MRALIKQSAGPGLVLGEVPKPNIGPTDVLIKVEKSAICGTDLHIYKWDAWAQKTIPVPMHVGHEFMGRIESIGNEVVGLKVGDRVSGEGHLTCGMCRNCRAGRRHLCRNTKGIGVNIPGSFAEYLALPAVNVFALPTEIPDRLAAIFDPFGNAVHTALAFNLIGEDILITGAGPIGIMAVAIAKHVGARHVVISDVNEYRLELARKMGATLAVHSQKTDLKAVMSQLKMTEGFDIGLEMSGHPGAFASMLSVMNHGGKIAMLGILGQASIDWDLVIFRGLTIKGIYGRQMFETWYQMASMLQSGLKIDPVITHELKISEFERGFELMASGQCGKVILSW